MREERGSRGESPAAAGALCEPPPPPPALHAQALVDRPDEVRRVENFKRLAITDLKVDIPRLAKKAVLKKALEEGGACRGGAGRGRGGAGVGGLEGGVAG